MSEIVVTLTSGPTIIADIAQENTINVDIIGTGPTATLPTASAEVLGGIKEAQSLAALPAAPDHSSDAIPLTFQMLKCSGHSSPQRTRS